MVFIIPFRILVRLLLHLGRCDGRIFLHRFAYIFFVHLHFFPTDFWGEKKKRNSLRLVGHCTSALKPCRAKNGRCNWIRSVNQMQRNHSDARRNSQLNQLPRDRDNSDCLRSFITARQALISIPNQIERVCSDAAAGRMCSHRKKSGRERKWHRNKWANAEFVVRRRAA